MIPDPPPQVQADWIKPGATVIDVGVNSKPAPELKRGYKLCGDVAFEEVSAVAGAITPVPGGVSQGNGKGGWRGWGIDAAALALPRP